MLSPVAVRLVSCPRLKFAPPNVSTFAAFSETLAAEICPPIVKLRPAVKSTGPLAFSRLKGSRLRSRPALAVAAPVTTRPLKKM